MHFSKPLSVFALLGLAAAAPSRIAARQDWISIPAGESPAANWGQWNPTPTSGSKASVTPSPASGKPSPTSGKPSPTSGKPSSASSSPAGGSPTTNCNLGPATPTTYTVVSGDTLSKIADHFGVGICDIQKANPTQITNVNNIFPNEVLNIPSGLCSIDNTSCLPPPAQSCISTGQLSYTVVSGDTLTSIAEHFNITLQSLENANQQVTNPDLIEVGQILNLPQCICPSS